MERKTPDEWLADPKYAGIVVTTPYGWDMHDFEKAWKKPLTDDEFFARLCRSRVESRGKVAGPGVVQHPLLSD
jgi:hypothetical protein